MFDMGRCGSAVNAQRDFTNFHLFHFFQLVTINQQWQPIKELEEVKKLTK